MDLVDIDQVLDNLELNEEAASQRQRAEERLAKELQQKCANGVVTLSNTNISVPLHRQSLQIDNKSMPQNHTNDADETDSSFQPLRTSAIVANCKKELAEYEREVEESQDIQKYSEPVKSNNKVDANNIEQLHVHCVHENEPSDSSESLTTSSPSTFSSGPSLEGDTSPDLSALQTVPLPAEPSQTESVDDLTEGLSSISINASNNLQTRSILPLETMASSSALVKVLDNITESNVVTKSALSQLLENQQKQQREVATAVAVDTSLEPHQNPNRDNKEETRVKVLATAATVATNASKQQPQVSAMQPITFCSTMDDISDTELDSMLQEMDIDDDMEQQQQQQQQQQHPQPLLSQEPIEVCQQQLQQHCEGVFKESVLACEESSLGAGADYLNGDSFSQASTVEFSEVRVPKQPDMNMDNDDEDLPPATTTTTTTTATIDSLGSNSSKADSISSSEESDSSSLEGDIIQQQQQLEDDLSKTTKCSRPRPQRPTTLNLPSLKSLDLYANAGQTPPGNETEVNEEVISPQTPSPEEQQHANTAGMTYEPHGVVHFTGMNNDVAEATGYSEDPHVNLGKVPPIWVPDNMATGCMQCLTKFTMIKRRHHCRACGKVLCSVCCSQKYKLEFLNEPDSRVCVQCYLILTQRGANAKEGTTQQVNETQTMDATAATNAEFTVTANCTAAPRSPNPNNPMEYCSTIPPHQQVSGEPKTPPSVIVPVGVLKKDNAGSYSSNSSNSSGQKARKRKSVMFSDGIAPGSDLATVEQWNEPKQPRRLIERIPKNSSSNNSNKNNKPPTPGKGSNHEHIADTSAMGMMAQFFRGAIPPVIAANTLHTIQQSALNLSSHLSKAATGKASDAMEAAPKIKPDSNKLSAAAMKTNEMLRAKRLPPSGCDENGSFIPHDEAESLPPIVIEKDAGGCDFEYKDIFNNYDLVQRLQKETLKFAVQKNLFVWVKIIHLKCCLNRTVINFTTQGMHHVGNDEIVVLLEVNLPASKEDMACKPLIPKDVFLHLNEIYNNADQGNPITELSHTNPQTSVFLGSRYYGGFIYIRPTYQCMQDVIVPENPYLIGILIHRNEVPWAKVFPLRLMLRLGAQFRYYPCPHVSIRQRESVYGEIAQTIINFLADFRNYAYTLPFIRGMYIHMEDRQTTVVIPRNRLEDVIKAVNDSSDHILAFGGNFSKTADGHLVCMQNVSEEQTGEMYAYSTQAINIQGQPRKVTGANFFVLNESLKTSSGLSGKCSIVEDGLMVQILPDKMEEVRNALKSQMDCTIVCGPVDADEQQTEIVCIKWVENDKDINIGVKSPIDDRLMDSVSSMRVHASFNYSNSNYSIRLTDIYVLKYNEWYNSNNCATMSTATTTEITRMTEPIARSASIALVPFLDLLVASKNLKIGLRFTLHQDNVCYEAGAGGSKLPPIYMNALDNHLIPTLHGISANIEEEIILELIFYILNV